MRDARKSEAWEERMAFPIERYDQLHSMRTFTSIRNRSCERHVHRPSVRASSWFPSTCTSAFFKNIRVSRYRHSKHGRHERSTCTEKQVRDLNRQ